MGVGQRLDARVEPRLEIAERGGVPRGLPRDRQHDGEQVLRAVRQLAHDQPDMGLALVALPVVLLEHPRGRSERIERAVGLRQAGVGERDRPAQHQRVGALLDLLDRPGDPPRRPHRQQQAEQQRRAPASDATRMVWRIGASNTAFSAASPITHPLSGDVTWAVATGMPSSERVSFQPIGSRRAAARKSSEAGLPTFCSWLRERAMKLPLLSIRPASQPSGRFHCSNSDEEDRRLHDDADAQRRLALPQHRHFDRYDRRLQNRASEHVGNLNTARFRWCGGPARRPDGSEVARRRAISD